MTQTKPRFQKGDLVKFKAKVARTNRYKNRKDKVFTVTGSSWQRDHFNTYTMEWVHGWLYKIKNWETPDLEQTAWQYNITPVKLPKP